MLDGPREVAVLGPTGDPATEMLHRSALMGTAPGAVVVPGDPQAPSDPVVPPLVDRPLLDGRPTAYVCRHFVCTAPTTDAEVLASSLR